MYAIEESEESFKKLAVSGTAPDRSLSIANQGVIMNALGLSAENRASYAETSRGTFKISFFVTEGNVDMMKERIEKLEERIQAHNERVKRESR